MPNSAQSQLPRQMIDKQTPPKKQPPIKGSNGLVNPTQGPSRATIDVKCGANSFTISTGNDQGACTFKPPGSGGGGGGSCSDGNGNSASVSCDTGCSSATGSGSCSGP